MNIYKDGELLQANLNNIEDLDRLWKRITKEVAEEQKYIKYVEIDQTPMYDSYELYIVQNYELIQSLNIVTITASESLNESIEGVFEYSARVINELADIYRPLYVEIDQCNWDQVVALIEGMEWTVNAIGFCLVLINQTGEKIELKQVMEDLQQNLQEQFLVMDQLLKEEDLIGFADILQYEIEPLLIKFIQTVKG
ncbi:hypothetical protein D3C74_291560 [compost metagenome]